MAGDGRLLVNFGALEQASADIERAITRLQTELDQLEHHAAPLVESWVGEAEAAYRVRQGKWSAAAADLTRILQSIKVAVDESASDYLSTERQATLRFQ